MKRFLILIGAALLAASAGMARADVARGLELFERGLFDESAAQLAPLAEGGVPVAQYVLGVMYLNMMVEPPDAEAAVRLITAAAESGHMQAQSELARMYRSGDGVAQDFGRMMVWYERAAEQGDVGAQLFVADGYAYGFGVEADAVEAYKWYQIAIQYWGPLAVRAREIVAEKMTAAQIAEAEKRSGVWLASHPSGQK